MNTSRIVTNDVESGFLNDVVAVLTALPAFYGTFFATCGKRDAATEMAGYELYLADPQHNPKYTNPANSAHVGANFADGCARAVDVTLVRNGRDVWEADADATDPKDPGWQALLAAVKAHPRLHSLVSIGDYDHIEKLDWQQDKLPTA